MEKGLIDLQVGDYETFEVEVDAAGDVIEESVEETIEKSEEKEESKELETTEVPTFEYDEDAEEEIIDDKEEVEEKTEEVEEKPTDNAFSVFANTLVESELLQLDEGTEITSEEDLIEATSKHFNNVVNEWVDEADEKSHGAVTFFLNGGTLEEFTEKFKNISTPVEYNKEDIEEKEEIQREIAEKFFKKTTTLSDKRIKKLVDNTVEVDGIDDVMEMYEKLQELDKKDKEDFKAQAQKKKEENEKRAKEYKETIYKNTVEDVKEFIPGRKIEKKVREKVFENISPTLQKVNNDLSKYAPILSYLDYYGLLDGDFSKIMKEAKTIESSKLGESIRNTVIKRNSDKKSEQDDDTLRIARASLRRKK